MRSYSERLLYAEGAGKTRTFTVPEGLRAVVKFVSARTEDPAGNAAAYLSVHGVWAWHANLPAFNSLLATELFLVAYERETIQLVTVGLATYAMVCGYLFVDTEGDPPWAPAAETGQLPAPIPHPWERAA